MGTQSEPTVFVVDGDANTRRHVSELVHAMDLRCEVYASGREFWNAYNGSRSGCLVLEVRVPGISGLQILRRLAAQGNTLPVVFLTAHADVPIAVRAMRDGAIHFLEKPVNEQELWDAIQEAVDLHQQRRDGPTQLGEFESRIAALPPKQRQLLEMITEGKSNRAIAAELGVCVRTIALRRKKLLKRLEVKSLVELLQVLLAACDGCPRYATSIEV